MRVGIQSHGRDWKTTLAQVAHEVLGIPWFDPRRACDTALTPYSTGPGDRVAWSWRAARSAPLVVTWPAGSPGSVHICYRRRPISACSGRHGHWARRERADRGSGAHLVFASAGPARDVAPGVLNDLRIQDAARQRHVQLRRACRDRFGRYRARHIRILDYVICEDGGTLVNPMIVDGQVIGGTAQGIGTAL